MKFGEAMRIAQGTDWVIPRYYKYLQGRRDRDVEAMHTAVLLTRGERDRTRSFSASGAGGCLRARIFAWLDAPAKKHSEDTMAIFLNGHWVHMRHQVVGLSAGYLIAAEVPVYREDLNLVGTMDALAVDDVPVEYKSINQNGFMQVRQFGPRSDHVMQVHAYMLAGDYAGARVVYENKNTNDLLEFYVERDEEIIGKVYRELDSLNKATLGKYLLPMLDECTRKEGAYRWCPFASQCPKGTDLYPEMSDIPATSSSGSDSPASLSLQDSLPIITRF